MQFLTILLMSTLSFSAIQPMELREDDHVIFYNTYGYSDGDTWVVPMRIYVYEYRPGTLNLITRFVRRIRDLNDEQAYFFRERARDFIVDSESRETVLFMFDDDPEQEIFGITDDEGNYVRSSLNGIIEGDFRIPKERIDQIVAHQQRDDGWLTIRAVSDGHTGSGKIKLLPEEGLSVISDVDDTIKITEIPAGAQIVVRNTFYKEFSPATEIAELYETYDDAFFHYVSGSPWQLYRPLAEFAFSDEAGFPTGTFHMKSVTKNFLSLSTWRDLRELVLNEDYTYDQKIEQISDIFDHFPNRRFILSGDSGERDPEVFNRIRELYPDQVEKIYIRDVVNDRELRPERLEGMTIIPAPTVFPGQTQFEWEN